MAGVTVAELDALRDRARADSLVEAVVLCAVGVVALIGGTLGTLAVLFFFGNRSGDLGHWMPQLDDAVGIGVAIATLALGIRAAFRARRP